MGTASFVVTKYATNRGSGAASIMSSDLRTSGAHTTSATASNIEDASGDIILGPGEVIRIHADEAMRVRFGGTAATASTGFYIAAGESIDLECNNPGTVSAIDVA
jgi:hypothetical protein